MTPELFAKFQDIARNHGICTLEERKSNSLDFKELHVSGILSLMENAYHAGVNSVNHTEPMEKVVEKYWLDFSKARKWPDDLFFELEKCTVSEFEVEANLNCDFAPVPYDYKLTIDNDDLVLEGGASDSGGYCLVKVPKEYEHPTNDCREYYITVRPLDGQVRGENFLSVKKKFESYGVMFVPVTDE